MFNLHSRANLDVNNPLVKETIKNVLTSNNLHQSLYFLMSMVYDLEDSKGTNEPYLFYDSRCLHLEPSLVWKPSVYQIEQQWNSKLSNGSLVLTVELVLSSELDGKW